MPWNPWIEIEHDDTNHEQTRTLFRRTANRDGDVSDLIRLTSRRPAAAQLIHDLCREVYRSAKGLTLREKEIAALVTSAFIGCVH